MLLLIGQKTDQFLGCVNSGPFKMDWKSNHGHGVTDRRLAFRCVCSPGFEPSNIRMVFLLSDVSWRRKINVASHDVLQHLVTSLRALPSIGAQELKPVLTRTFCFRQQWYLSAGLRGEVSADAPSKDSRRRDALRLQQVQLQNQAQGQAQEPPRQGSQREPIVGLAY